MAKKEKPQGLNISIGKELAYMIVLPKALDALSQKKRRHNRNQERTNTSTTYENLLCLKNSLDILFIQTNKKNTEEYKLQLYKKILTEKLILNIAAGKNSEIRQNIAQIMKDEGLNFVEREESLISPKPSSTACRTIRQKKCSLHISEHILNKTRQKPKKKNISVNNIMLI